METCSGILLFLSPLALQWSHAISRVETCFRVTELSHHSLASMEPRDLTRGNALGFVGLGRTSFSFNGATRSHAWKRPNVGSLHRRCEWLQWSHAISRVETQTSSQILTAGHSLQWSHAISRVETQCAAKGVTMMKKASMEPRDLTRGNRFISQHIRTLRHASMEPRDLTRGNECPVVPKKRRVHELQWSHAISRVETEELRYRKRLDMRASMEPRDLTRGNCHTKVILQAMRRASMEPRDLTRGNRPRT